MRALVEHLVPTFALVGPTATGKSAIAEALLRLEPRLELVNADPYQAYKGIDIGTATPHKHRDRYRLVNAVELDQPLDAVRFATMVVDQVTDIRAKGNIPLLVGGSGFYLQTLAQPLDPIAPLSAALCAKIDCLVQQQPEQLWNHLRAVAGAKAIGFAPGDQYRLGQYARRFVDQLSEFGIEYQPSPKRTPAPEYAPLRLSYIGLWGQGPVYEQQLVQRLEDMWEQGWIDEVRALMARDCDFSWPGLKAIGYREIRQWIDRGSPEVEQHQLKQSIATATRKFAKRQRTWFRKKPVHWFVAPTSQQQVDAISSNVARKIQVFGPQV